MVSAESRSDASTVRAYETLGRMTVLRPYPSQDLNAFSWPSPGVSGGWTFGAQPLCEQTQWGLPGYRGPSRVSSSSEADLRALQDAINRALADSAEGEALPTDRAVDACRRHLAEVATGWPAGGRFPMPHVVSSGDGDLLCYWRLGGRKALLAFGRDGAARAFAGRIDGGKTVGTRVVTRPNPDATRDVLTWVAGVQGSTLP